MYIKKDLHCQCKPFYTDSFSLDISVMLFYTNIVCPLNYTKNHIRKSSKFRQTELTQGCHHRNGPCHELQ